MLCHIRCFPSVRCLRATLLLIFDFARGMLELFNRMDDADYVRDRDNSPKYETVVYFYMEGFRTLQSFAGTLPADFDYKKEYGESCRRMMHE